MMLTSFPTYSLYKSSYTYNFLNRITLSFFLFSPVIQISIAFCILFSVLASIRIICCQRYIWPLSKYFWMLVASSQTYQPFPEYLRRSPVKSFTGLWHLWNQIIQLMQFSRYKRDFFECPFTYYSLETPKCCSLQKILSLIKPDRRILPTSFCNNLQKVFIHICTFAFMRIFIVLSF